MKDILIIILCVGLTIYHISNNKGMLKQLKKIQLFGVAITFIFTVILATILIFYGGNWIAGLFSNIILKYLVFGVIVIATFYLLEIIVNKVLYRITDGVFPEI